MICYAESEGLFHDPIFIEEVQTKSSSLISFVCDLCSQPYPSKLATARNKKSPLMRG